MHALWHRERPEPTVVGIVLTGISIVAMIWLARAKRRAAAALRTRALEADAFQTPPASGCLSSRSAASA
jgi:divalent metal cation (Fe/Co/Zn/Cd) transporter